MAADPSGRSFAERAGLTQSRLSELERGKYPPSLAETAAIEDALDLPRGGLLYEAGWLAPISDPLELVRLDARLAPYWREMIAAMYERGLADGVAEAPGPKPRRRRAS